MSSLQRSRSLRKPTASIAPPSSSSSSSTPEDADTRHGSPSRLPVKPLTRSATAAAASSSYSSSSSATTSTRPSRSSSTTKTTTTGPVTRASALSRSASVRQPTPPPEGNTSSSRLSRYPPSTTTTRPRPPPVAARGAAAPAPAQARPTSSDGAASRPMRRTLTHSRAKSTTTAGAISATTTMAPRNVPVLRPPSGASTSSASSTRTVTTVRKVSGGTTNKPPPETRPPAAKPVPKPVIKPAAAAAPPSTTTTTTTSAHPRLRPTFSTLQQHYSPAKSSAPKPLTATYLAPPSPSKRPANVAASAETARLQTELLQLHLLHRDAAAVDAEWHASARAALGERFAHLAFESRGLDARERAVAERDNVRALKGWAPGGEQLEERIRALDAAINGVWTLGEPGGRYPRVLRRFQRWVDGVCEVEEARRGDALFLRGQDDALFVGELDAAWKDDCAGLIRRLEGAREQLSRLGRAPPPPQKPETEGEGEGEQGGEAEWDAAQTSLWRIVHDSNALVDGMLEELSLMEKIEQEALAREDDWIANMNRDDHVDDTPRAGAIWRVV